MALKYATQHECTVVTNLDPGPQLVGLSLMVSRVAAVLR